MALLEIYNWLKECFCNPVPYWFQLKALLKDAFDDLIDEDDEFSVTSDEGGDSRNHSLHFRSKEET